MKKNQTKEIWVPAKYIKKDNSVLDFTGLYEVSDLGRVRSLNYMHTGKAEVLSQAIPKVKDAILHQVLLCKDSKQYNLLVHRLVLSSFKENEHFSGALADHIDPRTETSCDDSLCNLRWVTPQDNVSTEHCKDATSKANTNHPSLSKRVKVTDLTTGTATIYPSAREAGRSLNLPSDTISPYIRKYNGFYRKGNLHFAYV